MKQIITLLLFVFCLSNTIQAQCDFFIDASSDFSPYPCTGLGFAQFDLIVFNETADSTGTNVYLIPNFNTTDTIYPSSYEYYADGTFGTNIYTFDSPNSPASIIPNFSQTNAYTLYFADFPECNGYEMSAYTSYASDLPSIRTVTLDDTPVNTPLLNQTVSLLYAINPQSGMLINATPVDVPNHSFENGTVVYNETDQTFDYYPTDNFQGTDYFYFWAEVSYDEAATFQVLFKTTVTVGNSNPGDYGTYETIMAQYNSETGVLQLELDFFVNPNESYSFSVNGADIGINQTTDGVFTYGNVFVADYYYNSYTGNNSVSFEPLFINIENENNPTESYTFTISEVPFESNKTECSPGLVVDTIEANAYTTTLSFTGTDAWQPDLWRPCGTQEWNLHGTVDSLTGEFISSTEPLETWVPSDGWGYCFEFASYGGAGIYPYWETASSSYFNPQETEFAAKVFLEGPYQENGTMSTDLGMLLPTTQPFTESPYLYDGTESIETLSESDLNNIVDWVLVEARVGIPDNTEQRTQAVETKVGLLLNDGSIVSTDLSPLNFEALFGQKYHFCIRQRNHLDVLTSAAITDLDFNYDLTLSEDAAFGAIQLKQMSDGKFAMHAGDFSSEGVIQTTDYDLWFELPAALEVYENTDANLDGVIQVSDYDVWFDNKAKVGTSEVRLD